MDEVDSGKEKIIARDNTIDQQTSTCPNLRQGMNRDPRQLRMLSGEEIMIFGEPDSVDSDRGWLWHSGCKRPLEAWHQQRILCISQIFLRSKG
jgi:hypothetical protein